MNTTMEKALPGFLLLTDLASQIRIGRVINRGGNGILFEGFIVDPVLRSRAKEDVVAVKKIECKPASGTPHLQTPCNPYCFLTDTQEPEQAMLAFHHEITALWSLSFHPNVITLIAYDDSSTSIVTPLYDVSQGHPAERTLAITTFFLPLG